MKNEKEIKYFSMFTGVGGFELGIGNRAKCIGFSENNKYASELLRAKWPEIKNYGDATKINTDELPSFDFLCAGFPCQAFSIAGKRRGFEDTRGTLFFEIARIIKVKKPKIILLENVKGLLNHDKGQTFNIILQTISELGYDVQWMVLNSKFFGVPQNRERVFIIGSLGETSLPKILPFRESNKESTRETDEQGCANTLSGRSAGGGNRRGNYIEYVRKDKRQHSRIYNTEGISPTLAGASKLSGDCTPKIRAVLTQDRSEKRQNGRRFKEDGEPSFTLTGQDIHGVMENMKIRRLTPIECERLQGFPDNWTAGVSDTQRYKQMGNAVTVNVVAAIVNKLIGSYNGSYNNQKEKRNG